MTREPHPEDTSATIGGGDSKTDYDSPRWQAVEVPDSDADEPDATESKECDDEPLCEGHVVTDGKEMVCEECSLMHGREEVRSRGSNPGGRGPERGLQREDRDEYDNSERVIMVGGFWRAYLSDDDEDADSYEYCIDDFESILSVV